MSQVCIISSKNIYKLNTAPNYREQGKTNTVVFVVLLNLYAWRERILVLFLPSLGGLVTHGVIFGGVVDKYTCFRMN